MDKVQEIMGMVETYGEACENYGKHRKADAYQATENYRHLIEAALRKLVEREPLREERIWEIEAASNVSSRRPEYTKDYWGDDKTIWHETKVFSFPLFARNIERAHGIGVK